MIIKTSNCDSTQNLNFFLLKNSNCDQLKNSNGDKTQSMTKDTLEWSFIRNILTP